MTQFVKSIRLAALLVAMSVPALSFGAISLNFDDAGANIGSATAVDITRTGSFTVDILLNASSSEKISGVNFRFTVSPAAANPALPVNNLFQLSGRPTQTAEQALNLTPSQTVFTPSFLAPNSDAIDRGGYAPGVDDLSGPNNFNILSYTFTSLNAQAGVYVLNFLNPIYAGARDPITGSAPESAITTLTPYTINVVPEPTALGLAGLAGLALLRRRSLSR